MDEITQALAALQRLLRERGIKVAELHIHEITLADGTIAERASVELLTGTRRVAEMGPDLSAAVASCVETLGRPPGSRRPLRAPQLDLLGIERRRAS